MREQGTSDPQWVAVDLRAVCGIDWIRLAFECDAGDPLYTPPAGGNRFDGAAAGEIRSSYPLEFVVETSTDHAVWRSVYRTTAGTGGVVNIQPARPVRGRWVRMTSLRRSSSHPLGLSGFDVYGTPGALAGPGRLPGPAVIRAVRP